MKISFCLWQVNYDSAMGAYPFCLTDGFLILPCFSPFQLQAIYYNYIGDLPKALEHFLECANWQRAHTVFLTSVAHSMFLSGRELSYYIVILISFPLRYSLELRVHISIYFDIQSAYFSSGSICQVVNV